MEKVHQDSCLLAEDNCRTFLIFLIIIIGVKVIDMVIVDFLDLKDSKKVAYVGFQVKKDHQDFYLLAEDTWRTFFIFMIILIAVRVIDMVIVDFCFLQGC